MSLAADESILSRELLSEAALQLLGSSDASRYTRESRRLALESGLCERARSDEDFRAAVVERIGYLVSSRAPESIGGRSPEEIESSVLFCVLAECGADVSGILKRVNHAPSWRLLWLKALCARLTDAYGWEKTS